MGDNISKLLEKEGNIFKSKEENVTNPNNLESKLSEPPEELLKKSSSSKKICVALVELELFEYFI